MNIIKTFATVHIRHMDHVLPYYEKLVGKPAEKQWQVEAIHLEFAVVGNFVLVAGTEEALAFVSEISNIFYVDSIQDYLQFFAEHGGELIRGPIANAEGTLIVVRHPDGRVQEYLEPHQN